MVAACPDENRILAYLEGQFSDVEAEALDAHMAGCEVCRQLLGDLARTMGPLLSPPSGTGIDAPDVSGPDLPPLLPWRPGATLGRYQIQRCLGSGGMGIVYAAHDPELDRRVAIKLVRSDWAQRDGTDARARLRREARSLARLSHPNVVAIHDVGNVGDQVFITMEYLEGQTLRSWLRTSPRTPADVLAAFLQAGAGLAGAHAVGLVHRDFKLDNVLIGQDGVARVTDFGLARLMDPAPREGSDEEAPPERPIAAEAAGPPGDALSSSGVLVGTPSYMAPELHRGARADASSDQYAFCVALYRGLYKRHPFHADSSQEVLAAMVRGDVARPPADRSASVPPWIYEVLKRGLRPVPAERFPSMSALLSALRHDPRELRRRRLRAAALLLVSLCSVAGVSLLLLGRRQEPCSGAEARLRGVWDRARSNVVREALRRAGRPPEDWQRVAATLDQYAERWAAQHREVCEAALRREISPDLSDLRMECLEQRRGELLALTGVLSEGTAQGLGRVLQGAGELTAADACATLTTLSMPERLPADRAAAARIADLRVRQSHINLLGDSGRLEEGLKLVQATMTEVRAVGYRPLEAELLIVQGFFQLNLSDRPLDRAEQSFREAMRVGEAARHDTVKLDAMRWLIHVIGIGFSGARANEAEQLAHDARATLERIGADEIKSAGLDRVIGRLLIEQGRLDEAEPLLQRALSVVERVRGSGSFSAALGLAHLGLLRNAQHRYPEAEVYLRRALAILVKEGAGQTEDADIILDLTRALIGQGRFAEAEEAGRRMMASYRTKLPGNSLSMAIALDVMARPLLALGCQEEALATARQAVTMFTALVGMDHPLSGQALLTLAEAQSAAGRHEEALRSAQQASDDLARRLPPDHRDRRRAEEVLAAVRRAPRGPAVIRHKRCGAAPPGPR